MIILENNSRVKEILLFILYKYIHSIINYLTDTKEHKTDLNERENHSDNFQKWSSSIFFAFSSSISLYCLFYNSKSLKTLDKFILLKLFPNINDKFLIKKN
jgi:hypothetical protein